MTPNEERILHIHSRVEGITAAAKLANRDLTAGEAAEIDRHLADAALLNETRSLGRRTDPTTRCVTISARLSAI